MSILISIAGLALLVFAGDALVRGAVALSLRLGVPALIVSLTIIGFGTSAPEMLIAVKAALEDAPGLALGNVVGSNIANVFLVLGVPAMIATLQTSACDTKRSFLQMVGASVIFIGLAHMGPMHVWHGLVLLALLSAMLASAYVAAQRSKETAMAEELEEIDPHMPVPRLAGYLAFGLIGLPIGASLLIDGAREIALSLGVTEEVIGLTLVAVGTSLPELATTVMAAIRRQAEVAIGNVIGSNMFNLLAIVGVASLVAPLPFPPRLLGFDLWFMLAAALILAPFVFLRRDMGWMVGGGFLAVYAAYTVTLF